MPLRHLLALLLLAPGVLLAQEAVPPAEAADDAPVWAVGLSEALDRARSLDRRVLVELRNAHCPECERMEKLVYPVPSFRDFMRDKVAVSVPRGTEDGRKLVARFRVRATPAWLVVTPDLLLCAKQEGASNQSTWFERFVEAERAWASFRRRLAEETARPDDLALALAVGEEAYRRYGDAFAESRFWRVAAAPLASPETRARALSFLATIALEARRFDDAEKALDGILATAKDPVLLEKAELRLADVAVGRGKRDDAAARLRAFVEKHPSSPMKAEAEALLKALADARK